MQPSLWQPPVELSGQEEHTVKRIRKAKLFVFLRQHRHELLDEAFQHLCSLPKDAEFLLLSLRFSLCSFLCLHAISPPRPFFHFPPLSGTVALEPVKKCSPKPR